MGDVTQDLFEILENSTFLDEALKIMYGEKIDHHPYKFFQIQDIDDFPYIEEVAKSVKVEKMEENKIPLLD